ncbi:nardilysin [Trifolium repens]|nr:nardilysin [Trifolium repens]
MSTDDRKYEVIHDVVQRELKEGGDDKILETLLCEDNHKPDDKLSHLYDLSFNDVREFIEDIRSQIFIEGLVHGNLSEDDAINISKIFEQIEPEKSPPTLLRHVRSLTFLPPNINFVVDRLSATNMSSAELYIQIGQNLFNSINLMALLDLFEVIVKKPFFDQLR